MANAESDQLNVVRALYEEHHSWLFAWLRKKLDCPENAADLAQDTFARVLMKRESLHFGQAKALLITIGRGLVGGSFPPGTAGAGLPGGSGEST